jgi:hypothetical protein
MNRLIASVTCFALFTAAASAQGPENTAPAADGPSLSVKRAKDGTVTATAGPHSEFPGLLVLLGSFDGSMVRPGPGLPPVLANSAILAWTFAAGAEVSVSANWPPIHVLLQAVEIGFEPFTVKASPVLQIGKGPLTDAMIGASRAQSDADRPPTN